MPFVRRKKLEKLVGAVAGCAVALLVLLAPSQAPVVVTLVESGGAPMAGLLLLCPIATLLLASRGIRRTHAHGREMRERLLAQRAAHALAKRDPLTGLLNRRGLIEEIVQLSDIAVEARKALVLMALDLDNFKQVNDGYGHLTGDALIREVALRLVGCCPPDTLIARMGGDEFALSFAYEQAHPMVPESIARGIVSSLSAVFEVNELHLHVGASLGLVASPDGNCDVSRMLQQADVAMYRAKQSGRNCFCWFDRSMEHQLLERSMAEAELRLGIPRGEIVPYYEPQLMLGSGEIVGFEVLARWNHPQRGIIAPNLFIAIAEESGLIAELSLQLMRQALVDAREWAPHHRLAVNVSPVQLRDPLFAQKVLKLLLESGFPPHRLEIEITETALLSNLSTARAVVTSLKNQGVRLVLDDFGTGYSSLHHLRALPFDKIKIDRSFVSSILENPDSAAMVNAVLGLGVSLSVEVMAEGIETADIDAALRALDCRLGQGWFYSKPVPQAQLLAMLAGDPVNLRFGSI